MGNQRVRRRGPLSLAWPVASAAAVLGAGVAGLRLHPTDGSPGRALLAAGVLALTSALGVVWQSRARGARRLKAALDAYAEREIARDRRGKAALDACAERDALDAYAHAERIGVGVTSGVSYGF